MSSVKCAQCGLVNFASDGVCKRCRAPLGVTTPLVLNPTPQGIVLEDGYVLPPPPSYGSAGVWRDKSTLVMTKDAILPDRCVKCNVPTTGRLKRKLSWHHPALFLIILVALLIYLIVAMVLRKSATVEIGLCEEHKASRRRNIMISWGLVLGGIIGLVMAAGLEDGTFAVIGFLSLIAGIIFAVVAARVVVASKIDDKYVWLKGINKDYLNELPQWVGG